MKTKQTIKFSGRNIDEIFRLPCVKAVIKSDNDEPVLIMKPNKMLAQSSCVAFVGDTIEELEDSTWNIITSGKNLIDYM